MKSPSENWMSKNWQASLLITIAAGVILYDMLAAYTNWINNPISIDNKVNLILILLAGYIIDMIMELRQLKNLIKAQQPFSQKSHYPFIDGLYDYISSTMEGIRKQKLEFVNRYDSMATLLRMIDSAKISYDGINYYLGGWKTGMLDFFNANMSAVHRGVTVRRFFILRDEHKELNLQDQIVEEIENQSKEGVEIYFIVEKDIIKIPFFRQNPIRGIGLYDGKILSYDTSPAKEEDAPIEITITWDIDEVSKRNPFPHLLNSGLLNSFPKDKEKLEKWKNQAKKDITV